MKPLAPALAALIALLAGCDDDDGGAEVMRYSAELLPLNDSGATGQARLEVRADELTVRITARGLEAGQVVPTYIRGFAGMREARCPRSGEDLAAREARAYGDRLFAVEPFPTIEPGATRLRYDLTLSPSPAARRRLQPLERRVLVLQAGERNPSPVACGELTQSDG